MKSGRSPRPLRFVRPDPSLEVAAEKAAAITCLVPLKGNAAVSARLARSKPLGWVPVYIGLVAKTFTDGRTKWLGARFATHWAWPGPGPAATYMGELRKQGTTVILLEAWAAVRPSVYDAAFTVGPLQHHDTQLRSMRWLIAREDLPDCWATRLNGDALEWRHSTPGETVRLPCGPAFSRYIIAHDIFHWR